MPNHHHRPPAATGAWVALLALTVCFLSFAQRSHRPQGDGTANMATATIAGQKFLLEVATDPESQDRGLAGRTSIPERGGMVFVFDSDEIRGFVMRDCQIPLDILYLNSARQVVGHFHMSPEAPRTLAEKTDSAAYESRLQIYFCGEPSRYVIEIRGGLIDVLGVDIDDYIDLKNAYFHPTDEQ